MLRTASVDADAGATNKQTAANFSLEEKSVEQTTARRMLMLTLMPQLLAD